MTFAGLLNQPNGFIDDIVPSMYITFAQVIVMTLARSALGGAVGAISGSKMIGIRHVDVSLSKLIGKA